MSVSFSSNSTNGIVEEKEEKEDKRSSNEILGGRNKFRKDELSIESARIVN
jgi:hypothetical protein